jgi:hypothetical protein
VSVDRLRRFATVPDFSSTNPGEMSKSPAFEFYLMKLCLEQIMNEVNKKFVVAHDQPLRIREPARNARLDRYAQSPL